MSIDQNAGAQLPLYGVPPQRTPVEFDAENRGLRIGPYQQRIDDPNDSSQVFSAYLSLLYAVRGAQPGEQLKLRTADLEALLLIVGDDPETIERRLIGLMGCTAQEAKVLGGALLRHRRLTATLGIAASLALGGAVAVDGDRSVDAPQQDVAQSAAATSSDTSAASAAPAAEAPGAAASSASGYPSPTTTSVLLAGLGKPAQPAGARTRDEVVGSPASESAGASATAPAAPAAVPAAGAPAAGAPTRADAGGDPVAVVVQAPPTGVPVMDVAPPDVDPLEGAIEIGDAVSVDDGASFAAPSPVTTVVETPAVQDPGVDAVVATPAPPAVGQDGTPGSSTSDAAPQVSITVDDTAGGAAAGGSGSAGSTTDTTTGSTAPAGATGSTDATGTSSAVGSTTDSTESTGTSTGSTGTTTGSAGTTGSTDATGTTTSAGGTTTDTTGSTGSTGSGSTGTTGTGTTSGSTGDGTTGENAAGGNGGAPKAHDNRDGLLHDNNGNGEHGGGRTSKPKTAK